MIIKLLLSHFISKWQSYKNFKLKKKKKEIKKDTKERDFVGIWNEYCPYLSPIPFH